MMVHDSVSYFYATAGAIISFRSIAVAREKLRRACAARYFIELSAYYAMMHDTSLKL